MSEGAVPVSIHILDKEYMVSCPPGEMDGLKESARFLDGRMRRAREGGKVIGTERIAVMTALNIIHEFQQEQREQEHRVKSVGSALARLAERIDLALGRRTPPEGLD